MDQILAKNANQMKTLEDRLHDAEDQAIQASRRVLNKNILNNFILYLNNLGCKTISTRSISDYSR